MKLYRPPIFSHGNYCGPFWSDGKRQVSVVGNSAAIDDFDDTCRIHDAHYAKGDDKSSADAEFFSSNIGRGIMRTAAAIGVGAQGLARSVDNYIKKDRMTRLRQSANKTKAKNNQQKATSNGIIKSGGVSRAPTAMSSLRVGTQPQINMKGDTAIIKHKSFVFSFDNSTAYNPRELPCNPGLAASFPWASSMASRFDIYRFRKLMYRYRTVCSTADSGNVMMSFDYDVLDELPATKAVQAQSLPNTEEAVWCDNLLNVPCDETWRFTRQGLPAGSNYDLKTYDFGKLIYSTDYGNDTTVVGELYVEYELELKRPTEPTPPSNFVTGTGTGTATPFSTVTNTGENQPFGVLTTARLNCVTNGEYLIIVQATGTTITAYNTIGVSAGSVTTVGAHVINGAATVITAKFKVRVPALAYLEFGSKFAGATLTETKVWITACDYDNIGT